MLPPTSGTCNPPVRSVPPTVLAPPAPTGEDGGVNTSRTPARPVRRRAGRARALGPLVVVGALAVGLAACGSSSTSSSSTSTTGATPTTTPTSTTKGSSGSSTTSTTTGTPAGTAACRTSSLALSFGSPNGTAGAVHYTLTFQNTGTTPCTLYGFPGVSFLDGSGGQIGQPAQRAGGTPSTVTVAAGASAYASVAVTDPGIPPCTGSTAAAHVKVFPPGETQAATVAAPSGMLVCSSPNTQGYRSSTVTPVSTTAI